MKSSPDEIAKAVRTSFAKFPHVLAVTAKLQRLMDSSYDFDDPELLVILGETGVGKSWLLRRFARAHSPVVHDTYTEIPVVYVPLPPKCTQRGLPHAILKAMKSPFACGVEQDLTDQAFELFRGCRVRLLLFDELNHLVDRGAERSHYERGDWVKQCLEVARIPICATGISRSEVLFRVNEQLSDRVSERVFVEPFRTGTSASNQMVQAMRAFDGLLGDIPRIKLDDPRNCERFSYATEGKLRGIRKILVEAVRTGGTSLPPRIDLEVLARAFRTVIYPNAPDERNPFCLAFDGTRLVGDGEPFKPRRMLEVERD